MAVAGYADPATGHAPEREFNMVEGPIKGFAIATVFWGVVGFLVGVTSPPSWPGRSSTSTSNGPPSGGCGRCIPRR